MSYDLQLAICGSTAATSPMALCLPSIEQVTLPDFDTLKNHVKNHARSRSFIILFSDLNDRHPGPILEDLKKEAHVFAIYIHVKPGCNLTFNEGNVFPVAKQFITYKITSSIIRFFETSSEKLLALNHIIPAASLKRKANAIKDQRRSINTTINACHVLLIPLNVTEEDLRECQERLINLCNDLCGEYEPRVSTLDDYFPSDENADLYGYDGVGIKCNFIKKISRIRMYVLGNEINNLHSLSQILFESESNDSVPDEYDTKYTFVEYQAVTEQTKLNLSNVLGYTWRSTNIILKRLDEIQNDIKFAHALERVNATLLARAMTADIQLNQQAMDDSDNLIELSGAVMTANIQLNQQAMDDADNAFRIIRQAENGPAGQNEGVSEEIDNKIQYDPMGSGPDY